jgi:hypothetical protein
MNENEELKEFLIRVKPTFTLEYITLICFIFACSFLLALGKFPYPNYAKEIIILLIVWVFIALLFDVLIKKEKKINWAYDLYLLHNFQSNLMMTWIIYNLGGIEWMGAIFFFFMLIYSNFVLPKRKGMIAIATSIIFYSSLAFLEYFNILPFRPYFNLGINLHQNFTYVFTSLMFVTSTFFFVGLATSSFADFLKQKNRELSLLKALLEEAKTVLEIKVRARTHELKELVENQEKIIQEKTKELQEKIDELERFRKIAVGRELKMVELKEKVKELEKELENIKKNNSQQ